MNEFGDEPGEGLDRSITPQEDPPGAPSDSDDNDGVVGEVPPPSDDGGLPLWQSNSLD